MEKKGYKVILKQKEFMKTVVAALINRFGDSIDAVASAWIVYELTGNAAWSAIIFGANRLPTVFITPLAGAWVESRSKKAIMIITDIIRAICVGIVATGFLFGFLTPWILLATTLVISTVEAFRGPACTAVLPKILKKEYFDYGLSLQNSLSTVTELVGTAAAAGIIALIGTAGAIYLDMVTFLLSAGIISFLHTGEGKMERQKWNVKEYFDTLRGGMNYVFSKKIVCFLGIFALLLNGLLVPFNSLQAPLAGDVIGRGAEVLAILGVSAMVGMLLGSVVYPMIADKVKGRSILFIGGLGIGVYYIGMIVFSPLYKAMWLCYGYITFSSFLFGLLAAMLNAYVNIEFMKSIDEGYLARAGALLTAVSTAATPVASFLLGAVVSFVSIQTIFVAVGILDIIAVTLLVRNSVLSENEGQSDSGDSANSQCA